MKIKVIGVENDIGAKLVRMLTQKHDVDVLLSTNPPFDLCGMQSVRMSPDQWLTTGVNSCVSINLVHTAALTEQFTNCDAIAVTLGRPSTDAAPYLGFMASIIAAATDAKVPRFVMLSDLGAADPQNNEMMQAFSRVESMLSSTPMFSTVLRCALAVDDSDPITRLIYAKQATDLPGFHYPLTTGDVAGAFWLALHDKMRPGGQQILSIVGNRKVATNRLHEILPPTPPPSQGVNLAPPVAQWLSREFEQPAGAIVIQPKG